MQGSLYPYKSVGLFSEHYVNIEGDRLPNAEFYKKLTPPDDIREEIKRLYDKVKNTVGNKKESQLEHEFIRPVLDILGYHYIVEVTTPAGSPDYAIFPDEESRDNADARKNDRYEGAIALADAKRWGRDFESRGNSLDINPNAVPTRQIANYITETGIEWGVLTDGNIWRLYNKNVPPVSQSFFEINLIEALDDPKLFHLFYAVFSGPAFADGVQKAILDESKSYWAAIGDDLKERSYEALTRLCNGFYHNNPEVDIEDVYEASVVFLYRLLFVLYAESRDLLPVEEDSYGSYSLKNISEDMVRRQPEKWSAKLKSFYGRIEQLFDLINEGDDSIGVYQYNGGLFKDGGIPFLPPKFFRDNAVPDRFLAQALALIAYESVKVGVRRRRIDYGELDVRHLGSIYEGLLEFHPKLEGDEISLVTDKGERKATGSYYTPEYIVNYIVENTLGPLTEDMKESEEVLTLSVLDPAMGSGHFLVGAIDYIGRRCLELAGSESEVSEDEYRRLAVERCIYGVDLNPLAVELAKLSLWLHTITERKPLSYLDHHLKLGNSLVGARIADLAELPKKGKKGQAEQQNIFTLRLKEKLPFVLGNVVEILTRETESIQDVEDKDAWLAATKSELEPFSAVADTWVGTYFGSELSDAEYADIVGLINTPSELLEHPEVRKAVEMSHGDEHRIGREFFHWELEFPEIFFDEKGRDKDDPGFDTVIGNPPYVSISVLDQATQTALKSTHTSVFSGGCDIIYLFLNQDLRLVKDNGKCSLIVARYFKDSKYAYNLRKHLYKSSSILEVVDFGNFQVFGTRVNVLTLVITLIKQLNLGGIARVLTDDKIPKSDVIKGLQNRDLSVFSKYSVRIDHINDYRWLYYPDVYEPLFYKAESYGVPLGDLTKIVQSMQTGNNKVLCPSLDTIKEFKIEEELIYKVAKSGSVNRYYFEELDTRLIWTEGIELSKYPNLKSYLEPYERELSRRYDIKNRKANWWEISNPRNASLFFSGLQRILVPFVATGNKFCVDNENRLNDGGDLRAIFLVDDKSYSIYYLCSILNSPFLDFFHKNHAKLKRDGYFEYFGNQLSFLPIREIHFATQEKERNKLSAELESFYASGDFDEIKARVDDYLPKDESGEFLALLEGATGAEEKSDVVHDFLAFLAERMLDMNVEKQRLSKEFLGWLEGETAGKLDDFRPKKYQSFWEYDFDEFYKWLRDNGEEFKAADHIRLETEFEKYRADVLMISDDIDMTDQLIDDIVYLLYGLTEDEIKVVERYFES